MKTNRIDELLKQAVIEFHTGELESIPSNEDLSELYAPLSDIFYKKIRTIISKVKRRYEIQKWTITAAITFLIVSTLWLISNPGMITKAGDAFLKWFQNLVQFEYDEDIKEEDQREYVIGYIPEGFEEKINSYHGFIGIYEYWRGNDQIDLHYSQGGSGTAQIDAENSVLEIIDKDGIKIYYMYSIEENKIHLVWEKNSVQFMLRTEGLSKEETFKIYESIYAKEKPPLIQYEITSMPDGYALYHEYCNRRTGGEIRYGSKDDVLELIYEPSIIELYVDENDPNLRIVSKEDKELYYYEYSDQEKHLLMWYQDGYIFKMTSILSKNEMVQIQESIQLKAAE